MKRVLTILSALQITLCLFSQAPEKLSYQAIIRNSSGQLISSQAVGMQVSILQDSVTGTAVYVENHTPSTNANGLVNIEIGNGTVQNGSFSNIDWANGPYFIKTETDPAGGTEYSITGTSQLLSVPYALHAKAADELEGTLIKVNAQNEWVNLIQIGKDLFGCWTITARAHDFNYKEKYSEWKLIVGDNEDTNANVYYEQLSYFGNATGAIELRVFDGYIQGRWTGTVGGGPFCHFKITFERFL
ncbi:MAG: hypothetical protein JXB00_12775 [Bacteroidales bacterium]|nr:hypothetical protein [Bacteroidales bacterium]